MNPDTLWQVFDTSAKIGIGALISAFFMMMILSRRQSSIKTTAQP